MSGSGTVIDPLRRALELLGDRWTLLILQSVFLRVRRYDDIRARLDISPGALSGRLRELVDSRVLERVPYRTAHRTRHEYHLTSRGLALWQLLVAIWRWEAEWVPGRADELPSLIHLDCGATCSPELACRTCGRSARVRDVRATRSPGLTVSSATGSRRFSRSSSSAPRDPLLFFPVSMELLGDRWMTGILVCALLGEQHFSEFQRELGIGPSVLSSRLRRLVQLDVVRETTAATRSDATAYRLTPKGRAFFPALAVIVEWARADYPTGRRPAVILDHGDDRHPFTPALHCSNCGRLLHRERVRVDAHPEAK
ncbi:MAG TPA: helix-turn-helix domain-containing protein [Pseudonocardia sp.]|jgi:DNA-binding HxlR family transcriptional regulator|nr:helix-turn-helix domain-containing protein [Pseudonocardia sp.]